MKTLILIPLFLFSIAFGQGLLPGLVTYQNSGNQPVPGALVKAGITNRAETDTDGTFSLSIPGKEPGYEILLGIEKEGYEVVNKKELFTTLRADASQRVKLYLCPEGEWERNALAYYQINQGPITQKYTNQVARIRRDLADQEQLMVDSLAALAEQYKIVLAQADELAEKFAIANLDVVSDLYEEAFHLFEAGKIDKALAALSDQKLNTLLSRIEQEKADGKEMIAIGKQKLLAAEQAIRQGIENYVLKARLCVVAFRFDEADLNFQKAVNYDSLYGANIFEYAAYLQKQNRFRPATIQYEKLLKLPRNSVLTGMILNNLAIAWIDQDDYVRGISAHKEALAIRRELVKIDENAYLPELATTLNNLGLAFIDQHDYIRGIRTLDESLEIRRTLASSNKTEYLPAVAGTLNNLGIAYFDQHAYDQGISAFQEALEIYQELVEIDASEYLPYLGYALNNFGRIFNSQQRYDQSVRSYEKALEIFQKLAATNEEAFQPYVATILHNLGTVYKNQDDFELSIASYKKALQIKRTLAGTNPSAYLPDVSRTLNNLGVVYFAYNQFSLSIGPFQEALQLKRSLVEINAAVYEPELANTQVNLGLAYFGLASYDSALLYMQEALPIHLRLSRHDIDRFGLEATNNLMVIGMVLNKQGHRSEAISLWSQANSLLQKCPDSTRKKNLQSELDTLIGNSAPQENILLFLANKVDQAESYQEKSSYQRKLVKLVEELYAKDPGDQFSKTFLAGVQGSLSWFLLFIKDFSGAETSALRGLEVAPGEEWIYTNLAHALLFNGRFKEAKAIYLRFKGQAYDETRSWDEAFLTDLDALEQAGITHPDVKKIRKLLTK